MSDKALSSLTQGAADTGDFVYGVVGGNSRKLQIGTIATVIDYADTGEAEAGLSNTTVMTPLRTKQALWALGRRKLTANEGFYWSTTGNDTTGTGTALLPFATVQRAWDYVADNIDPAGFDVTLSGADGTYTSGLVTSKAIMSLDGSGGVSVESTSGNASACIFSLSSGLSCFELGNGTGSLSWLTIKNFEFQNSGVGGSGIAAFQCVVNVQGCRFGNINQFGINAGHSAFVFLTTSYSVVGNMRAEFCAASGGIIANHGVTVTYSNNPVMSLATYYVEGGRIYCAGCTFTNKATVTGTRFAISGNGHISSGTADETYLPGDVAGTITSGWYNENPLPITAGGTGGATAAAARTALGLGTSATVNTGTSGATIPLLNGNNTHSGTLNVTAKTNLNDGTTTPLQIDRAANSVGPFLLTRHQPTAAADGDTVGGFSFIGRDDAGNNATYAGFSVISSTVANTTEAGRFQIETLVAGASGGRVLVGAGLYTPNATGTDKGVDTINAKAVYDDNVLLTDVVQEFAATGKVDLVKWDASVPDRQIAEQKRMRPVTIKRTVPAIVDEPDKDGSLVRRQKMVEIDAPVFADLTPIFDENGNGIGAREEHLMEEVVLVPAAVEPRQHFAARLFKDMIDTGFDPRDPVQYMAKVAADRALPGMPTEAEWEHGKFSLGEIHTRSVLAMEIMAQAMGGVLKRVEALERKS